MRISNYFLFVIFNFMINCVQNNDQGGKLYGNLYLIENVPPNQIKSKFLETMKYADMNKPLLTSSKTKNNINAEPELIGALVLLRNVKHDKHDKSSTEIIKINYNNTQYSRIERQSQAKGRLKSYIPELRKDNLEIVGATVDDQPKKRNYPRQGLSIEDLKGSIRRPKTMDRSKLNVLRDKYGDACIKVAIRKCYKALSAVNKNVCKARYKCKSSFKSYFKKKSKEACINEFDYSKGNYKEKMITVKFRDNTFVDATREGYLDSCIPYMVPEYKVLRRSINLRNDTLVKVFDEVLRKSKSDKKCQKLSQTKSYRACIFALDETCSKYECSKRRKKTFRKVCKEECKRAYRVIKKSDSSGSSSAGSSD